MKFATIGHLDSESRLKQIPREWIKEKRDLIVSPELNINNTKGYIIALKITAQHMMNLPKSTVRQKILDSVLFAQNELDVNIIQLGALTTSVTSGGLWVSEQDEFTGFVNHGDSYTAAITCKIVEKALNILKKESLDLNIAIVGAYGIIGEAVSKILVPRFQHSILIGRREKKLEELSKNLIGNYDITTSLKTKSADIIVTATSHPTALLNSNNLKKNAIIVDVSQPVNLTKDVCQRRPDIFRIDGGYVDFPIRQKIPIPGMPSGKIFSCIAEVIMQAMENEQKNHVGSIDMEYLKKTETLGEKYKFVLSELTNFGVPINNMYKI
ncbi:MAG: hypothetical protein R6V50_01390 [Thermoplasmatota archaeon]